MPDVDDVRSELKRLGAKRERMDTATDALAAEVTVALKKAYGKISVAEAARLLRIHRTTVYRVYHPHD